MDPATLTRSLLYLDGINVTFDGYKALRGLSLALAPGEMRAIIGPNGAGKTTMMDVVTGKTRPDEGERRLGRGQDPSRRGRRRLRRRARPARPRRGGDRRARDRAEVPEADRVREPHGRRQ